ncbi:uncharacterized protein LOC123371826 [Mauremys mutica]|uniref:uncharacterized protein LOC123371826 n=1 Tax=Mauremys mutica TaxID=74926 RepID=UPI001D1600EA|nr:uncharacterized protein LOC123371826 [Mauremys mutica]
MTSGRKPLCLLCHNGGLPGQSPRAGRELSCVGPGQASRRARLGPVWWPWQARGGRRREAGLELVEAAPSTCLGGPVPRGSGELRHYSPVGEGPDVAGAAAARATCRWRGAGVDASSALHWLVQITLFLALGQCLACAGILEATIQCPAALLFFGPMVPVLSDALGTFRRVVPALLVFSMSVLAASLLYAGIPGLRALLPRALPPGR